MGSDVKSVQSMLGHATASFTLDVYGHVSEKMQKDTAARMQGYYDNISKQKQVIEQENVEICECQRIFEPCANEYLSHFC